MLTIVGGGLSGCGSTCADDGFVWQQAACPNAATEGATGTESATESESATQATDGTVSDSMTDTQPTGGTVGNSMTASEGTVSDSDTETTAGVSVGDTETATESDSDTDTAGGDLWCIDADMDGFGDPTQCTPGTPGEDPPPGSVGNGDDCDDQNDHTFPGAAELDDRAACMQDFDDDGFGDPTPDGPDTVPGTDCDDLDVNTFPGAAETEDPAACMKDEDGDGWGDTSVPEGVIVGSDCIDTNPALNPTDRLLYSVLDGGNNNATIGEVNIETGDIGVYGTVDIPFGGWNVYSSAVSPSDGVIYGHNSDRTRLVTLDYCADGSEITELEDHDQTVCGIAFDAEGVLYGIDSGNDALVTFDPATGAIVDSKPLTLDGEGVAIISCGLAFDCVTGRLLLTDGQASRILSVDPTDGSTMVVADPMLGDWNSVGAEYDPVTKEVYVADGAIFMRIAIDGSNDVTMLPNLTEMINDLNFGPTCG